MWVCGVYEKQLSVNLPNRYSEKTGSIDNIRQMVERGYTVHLGCHCAPQQCHGFIVKNVVMNLVKTTDNRNNNTVSNPKHAYSKTLKDPMS